MSVVAVANYGLGNVKSIVRAVEKVGGTAVLSDDHEFILNADKLILPGVGAFEDGMTGLRSKGLDLVIKLFVKSGKPVLGICLGMQMLLNESDEFGIHQGLGLISGRVVRIPSGDVSGFKIRKIPHIGWNTLFLYEQGFSFKSTSSILPKKVIGQSFYFVHSYMAVPEYKENAIAYCVYEEQNICAVIQKDNVYGCQFHPEKSGVVGLTVLKTFVNMPS